MLSFLIWVLLLAALLFWPVSNLVWTLSVRRKQRKLNMQLDAQEIAAQKQRARFIAAFVCLLFSVLYNLSRLGMPTNG